MAWRSSTSTDLLRQTLLESVALTWTHTKPTQEIALRAHATPGSPLILRHTAELLGKARRAVEPIDIVTVPSHQTHVLTAVACQDLHVPHIGMLSEGARLLFDAYPSVSFGLHDTCCDPAYHLTLDEQLSESYGKTSPQGSRGAAPR